MHILACVTYPLETIFPSVQIVKTPTHRGTSGTAMQIADIIQAGMTDPQQEDSNFGVATLRGALQAVSSNDAPAQLWQQGVVDTDCSSGLLTFGETATLANMVSLNNSLYASLPGGFNTGIITQFSPRVNSSAHFTNITDTTFPTCCKTLPGAFYVDYNHLNGTGPNARGWRLIACMPAALRQSPWNPTHNRQDFSEELYLNITIPGGDSGSDYRWAVFIYKVTVNTTAGYFELPECKGPITNGLRRQNDSPNNTTFSLSPILSPNQGPLFSTTLRYSAWDHSSTRGPESQRRWMLTCHKTGIYENSKGCK
jgi:hypothetical protein